MLTSAEEAAMDEVGLSVLGNQQFRDVLCGSIAGICGKLVEHPVDTIKVRLQTQSMLLQSSSSSSSSTPQRSFAGPLDCLRQTWQREGLLGLYRGLPSPLLGAMTENATLFMGYNYSKNLLQEFNGNGGELGFDQLLLAGAMASACAAVVLTPIELVKCRAQVASIRHGVYQQSAVASSSAPLKGFKASAWGVLVDTLRTEGPAALYRGFSWTAVREIGGGTAWFGAYELVCKWHLDQLKAESPPGVTVTKTDLQPWQLMMAGAAAGVSYNASFFPADVLKSIAQTQKEKMSLWKLVRTVYGQGGVRAFYQGLGITVLRAIPSNALIFLIYETLSEKLNPKR